MEAILWKPLQLFRRILTDVSSITKAPSLPCWLQFRQLEKNQLQPGQGRRGGAPVLSRCSSLRNPWRKPTGVLENCHEARNKLLVLHFSGRFLLIASPQRRKMSTYISLFTIAIPVNYTSESPKSFEDTMYVFYVTSGRTPELLLRTRWRENFSEAFDEIGNPEYHGCYVTVLISDGS